MALDVVVKTIFNDASNDKFGLMTTPGFQYLQEWWIAVSQTTKILGSASIGHTSDIFTLDWRRPAVTDIDARIFAILDFNKAYILIYMPISCIYIPMPISYIYIPICLCFRRMSAQITSQFSTSHTWTSWWRRAYVFTPSAQCMYITCRELCAATPFHDMV